MTTPGTSVPLSANSTAVPSLRVQPRASATSMNVGNVYIVTRGGSKNTPGSIYAVLGPEQTEPKEISKADDWRLIDLSQWAVDADNAGDGVLVGYAS